MIPVAYVCPPCLFHASSADQFASDTSTPTQADLLNAIALTDDQLCTQVIAEKCRVFVYSEDESQVAPSESSGTGGRDTMDFDPLRLSERNRALSG